MSDYYKSHNILYIESLGYAPKKGNGPRGVSDFFMGFEASFIVKFRVTDNGNIINERVITSNGVGFQPIDAMRDAVVNFFKADSDYEDRVFDVPVNHKCQLHNSVNHVELKHIKEPYRSLFENLFDINKWEIPKKLPQKSR